MSKMQKFNKCKNAGNELISKKTINVNLNRFLNSDANAYVDGQIPAKHKE